MPGLKDSLQGFDLGHLRIIAEHWHVEFNVPDIQDGLQCLVTYLQNTELISEILESLPKKAYNALIDLLTQPEPAKMPWSLFTRRYGEVRIMGAARRDRERPDRSPISPAEILWYYALIARGFFDTPNGLQEFAYIPDEFIPLIPPPSTEKNIQLGRPASPQEYVQIIPACDHILDDACTLLAALRNEIDIGTLYPTYLTTQPKLINALLSSAEILTNEGKPNLDEVKRFLELPRGEALSWLAQSWLNSKTFNDLKLMPGIKAEGEWENQPLQTRQTVIHLLSKIPKGTWWSVSAFISAIHDKYPDFQRPMGDYDSWYIRDAESNEFLHGFQNWHKVEGALLHFLIEGPLHWLGILDLGRPNGENAASAFRFSKWADALLSGNIPSALPEENKPIQVAADGAIIVNHLVSRSVRYQIARFTEWEGIKLIQLSQKHRSFSYSYQYRITPISLKKAIAQNLTIQQLIRLLQSHASSPLPPALVTALKRWQAHGTEVKLEYVMILRATSPKILAALRASRAARFLGDQLSPTTIVVKPNAGKKVLVILAELGYLGEGKFDDNLD